MTTTLAIDCGGTGIKCSLLDGSGAMLTGRRRVRTPYPLPPSAFVAALLSLAEGLDRPDRVTVGMPGMVRHGVVHATPHYVTTAGPGTAVDPDLARAWRRYDARAAVEAAFGVPTLVLNDAEVAGAGLVQGSGVELVLTLGTGLGYALFDDGRLAPHLELSHAVVRKGTTYDAFLGNAARRSMSRARWSRRVRRAVAALEPVFCWDRLYLGGGNSRHLDAAEVALLPATATVVPNTAGILGGVRAWELVR